MLSQIILFLSKELSKLTISKESQQKIRDFKLLQKNDDWKKTNIQYFSTDIINDNFQIGKPIKIGVIGVGNRGTGLLLKLLTNYSDFIQEVLIFDESSICLQKALNIFQEQNFNQVRPANSFEEILQSSEISWVFIATINSQHAEQCIKSMKHGKNVFCEKPLATSLEDCKLIYQTSIEMKNVFMTGFVLRYSQFYQKIKAIISSGEIGKLVSVEANELINPDHGGYIMRNWRRHKNLSGPHILEKCCHDIDLINWIVESLPSKVCAFGGNDIFTKENNMIKEKLQNEQGNSFPKKLYENWPVWEDVDPFTSEKSIEDNLVAIIQYQNNVRATFHSNSCSAIQQRRILFCGLEGTLEADLVKMKINYKRMPRNKQLQEIQMQIMDSHAGGDILIVMEWFQLMTQENQKPLSSVKDCLISTITTLAIDEARQNNLIVDLEPIWKQINQ